MAAKQDVLKALEEMLQTEEEAIPIYLKHITNTLFLSPFSPEKQDQLKATLQRLSEESRRHKEAFEEMIRSLKESSRDVY